MMHGDICMSIGPCVPMPRRKTSGFPRSGGLCVHQAQSAATYLSSGMKGDLHLPREPL